MQTKFFKIIIPFFLLVFITGCSFKKETQSDTTSNQSSYKNDIPSWYLNSPNNTKTTLYGVGEGKTLDESRTNALNNMSSKIMVNVDSTLQTTKVASNKDYQRKIKQEIKVEVEKLKYQNVETKNALKVDNTYYTLLSVDRNRLFSEQKKEFERVDKKIDASYQENKGKSNFLKVINLEDLKPTIDTNSKQAYKLYAINNDFNYDAYLQKYDKYLGELKSLKGDLKIHITSDENKDFLREFKSILNNSGYKVLEQKKNNEIDIKLENIVNYSEVKGWNVAKVASSISVTTASMPLSLEDKIMATTSIYSSGKSSSSKEVALSNASKDFAKEVEKIGLEKILFNKQDEK